MIWVNTGDAFPETLAQMEKVKAMCPHFLEIRSDQPSDIAVNGYPVDTLPIRWDVTVQRALGTNATPLQPFLRCCQNNIMAPMEKAVKALGATMIIRGQKNCDTLKSSIKSGEVVDGIKYLFPIEDWTDAKVLEVAAQSGLLPAHYKEANTSLDCMHCTAYLRENQWKLPYLKRHYPSVGAEVARRFIQIHQITEMETFDLRKIVADSATLKEAV